MTSEARLVKGLPCSNCGEPMVAHCSRHVIPCCPHYPQHEPAAAPAEGLRDRYLQEAELSAAWAALRNDMMHPGDHSPSELFSVGKRNVERAYAALARHESAGEGT